MEQTTDTSQNQWIDLADLSGLVASLKAPDTKIDAIIDAMLAGPSVVRKLTMAELRDTGWLESQPFTRGGAALRVLLQRRGLKARTWSDDGITTTAVSDLSGNSRQASGHDDVVSTLLAIILFETTRQQDA
ncbi:hypothetical protein G6L37_02195 [Agrobacterium rubi]|nr:hypothetical protein [Agrobacterium rubi]NTF24205.1 hypothetical protein [Agrobacterium rubi]